jgi:primosomal replication protein N
LEGTLLKKDALRYTPAGVAIIECVIKHGSVQMDAKKPRSVELEIDAQSAGEMAQRMSEIQVGATILVRGFLAKRSLQSSRLVLHVNDIAIQTKSD